jgi:hypothetical protein
MTMALFGSHLSQSEKTGSHVFFAFLLALSLLLAVPGAVRAAQVTLAWDASTSSNVTGYKLHYGTTSGSYTYNVDAGNATSYTLSALSTGVTYYFAATAYDSSGDESAYSNEVAYTVTGESTTLALGGSSGGGGGGGGCFIATAAFGSYLDPHVAVLRSFRDSFLLTNRLGNAFVSWYYAASPPYADAIRQNGPLKTVVRIALFPVIGFAYLCLATGVVPALLMTVAFLAALAWGARRLSVEGKRAKSLFLAEPGRACGVSP